MHRLLGLFFLITSTQVFADPVRMSTAERIQLVEAMQKCWTQRTLSDDKKSVAVAVNAEVDGVFKKLISFAGSGQGDIANQVREEFAPMIGSRAHELMVQACYQAVFGTPLQVARRATKSRDPKPASAPKKDEPAENQLSNPPPDSQQVVEATYKAPIEMPPKDGDSALLERNVTAQPEKRSPSPEQRFLQSLDEVLRSEDFGERTAGIRKALATKDPALRIAVIDRVLRSKDPLLQQIVLIKVFKSRENTSLPFVAYPSSEENDELPTLLTGLSFYIDEVKEENGAIRGTVSGYPFSGTISRTGLTISSEALPTRRALIKIRFDLVLTEGARLIGRASTESGLSAKIELPLL
jgi:hypothetical protein